MANDPLSLTFAALADPTRRAVLVRLAEGEATVNELAAPFDISLQAVSKHLKVLQAAGLISRGREAQYRPCHFEPAPLEAATDWIARNRQIWTERFDQLDRHLELLGREQAKEKGA
jgi:DNA-binding transcriptional ArsR family regulator